MMTLLSLCLYRTAVDGDFLSKPQVSTRCSATAWTIFRHFRSPFIGHVHPAYITHGPSRTIWLEETPCNPTGNIFLRGFAHSTKPDNYSGYVRLEHHAHLACYHWPR